MLALRATTRRVIDTLLRYSRYAVPHALLVDIADTMDKYGRLKLIDDPVNGLVMVSNNLSVLEEVLRAKRTAGMFGKRIDDLTIVVHPSERGHLKQALLKVGWLTEDLAGYVDGEAHEIDLAEDGWTLRDYQRQAAEGFWHGGSGVVVLPCGAGKTLVGAAAMAMAKATTLILVTSSVSAQQWRDELIRRTSLTDEEIGEYSGARKEVRPVTIATYQVLTSRRKGVYPHLDLFDTRDWGLIIYDEVHLLLLQCSDSRLICRPGVGLGSLRRSFARTAMRPRSSVSSAPNATTPHGARSSPRATSPQDCVEVRVSLPDSDRLAYATAEQQDRYRLAATAKEKVPVVKQLIAAHPDEPTLVIGQYLDQLADLAEELNCPVITGETKLKERQSLYDQFRRGELPVLLVSKVANFSIDLPDASVAIQVSGSFGSRQEEAQRLGRILRPKQDGRTAHFYTIVVRDTVDAEFAANRQRFLAEQGYPTEFLMLKTSRRVGSLRQGYWLAGTNRKSHSPRF